MAQLAIAWTLRRPEVTAAIVGARRPDQVDQLVGAGDWQLSPSTIDEVERLLKLSRLILCHSISCHIEINVQGKATKRHWLVKSEPHVFSIDDLAAAPEQKTYWDGVRNYQARNTLRDLMQIDDPVLFYHSNCDQPCIAGLAKIVRAGYPDFTAWDPQDPHYDPKTDPKNPRWYMVDIQFVSKFARPLSLASLRSVAGLEDMVLLQKGSRLSVQPVSPLEYSTILKLSRK